MLSSAAAAHVPLAQLAFLLQKAPGGNRQLPPVHADPSGQSLLLEHVWHVVPLWQKWVGQPTTVQGSPPVHNLPKHCPEAQSPASAHGYPPGSKHAPALHLPPAQSPSPMQAAQTLPAQRALLQASSSAQASPFRSLQKPALQVSLKQPPFSVQASPKWPLF